MTRTALFTAALPLFALGCVSQPDESSTLQDSLDDRKARWAASAPDETKDAYDDGIEQVKASGVLESAKNVGDRAPGFTLPNAEGKQVSLDSQLKDGPVILVFYRGEWCPYCNMTLAAWQEKLEQVRGLGADVIAITPQTPDKSWSEKEKSDLEFHVLSDVGNLVADRFGITTKVTPEILKLWEGKIDLREYNGDDSGELPLPATYLVGQDRTIHFAHVDAEYRVRAEPSEVIAKLIELQNKK